MSAETTPPAGRRLRPPTSRRTIAIPLVVALVAAAGAAGCALRGPFVHPALVPAVDAEPIVHRLILIGDAGEPREPEPVLTAGRIWAERQRGRTSVLFLGDNVYPRGIVESRRAEAERKLARQIDAFSGSGATLAFIPGNHDWDDSGASGLVAVQEQAAFVRSRGAHFAPAAGCPGPEVLDLPSPASPVLRVVAIDTQWWLHQHARGADCTPGTPAAVEAALGAMLATPLPVVVAGHHPLATGGPHSGFYDWRAHLFPLGEVVRWGKFVPLPLVGSLNPLIRRLAPSAQDLANGLNRDMRLAIERSLAAAEAPALKIHAAGHEHSLQVMTNPAVDFALVSGSGSSDHQTPLRRRPDTLFAHSHPGFMVLDLLRDGVRLSIVDPTAPPDAPTRQFLLARRR